jgi:molybdopterin converting factor small subunit
MTLTGHQPTRTVVNLREIIAQEMEPTEPQDTILRVLKEEFEGKRLTVKVEERLRRATGDEIRILKHHGWTDLVSERYWANQGNKGGCCLMVARSETNVIIDTEWMERENARYFSALRERNARRQLLLSRPDLIDFAEHLIQQYLDAKRDVQEHLLKDPEDELWGVLYYAARRVCGFDK